MQIVLNPAGLPPSVVALGMFDGFHLAHQALVKAAVKEAMRLKTCVTVFTFEPHPLAVLRPGEAPPRLTLPSERARLMAEDLVDVLAVERFTPELAHQSPEAFLAHLQEACHPAALVCGFNFTFGDRGSGDGETLTRWGKANGVPVRVLPPVTLAGVPVSSTRVRRELERGDCLSAARLLGRPYALSGKVEHGRGLGQTLGFPTANLRVHPDKALPADGVYLCAAEVSGNTWPAVVNIGKHPTLPGGPRTVEAHLLDFVGSLYGRTLRLHFLRRLRDERLFDTPEALRDQVDRDRREARRLWEEERQKR
ncbi:MAG: bifunctional riboflavin kinase/FAD synthetase [Clostridia bacterium]|nr:bifunctional riboflavin kinase/FAD synthetase [Clostridia bacterium]